MSFYIQLHKGSARLCCGWSCVHRTRKQFKPCFPYCNKCRGYNPSEATATTHSDKWILMYVGCNIPQRLCLAIVPGPCSSLLFHFLSVGRGTGSTRSNDTRRYRLHRHYFTLIDTLQRAGIGFRLGFFERSIAAASAIQRIKRDRERAALQMDLTYSPRNQ